MILFDTNLLTRVKRSQEAQSGVARAAIQTLIGWQERLIVVPQNLYEFWALATRSPGVGERGQSDLRGTYPPRQSAASRESMTLVRG